MSKKKKKDRLKVPKELGGVKIPKDLRRNVNAMLKQGRTREGESLLLAAAGMLATTLAAKLEEPLKDFLLSHGGGKRAGRNGREVGAPTAH